MFSALTQTLPLNWLPGLGVQPKPQSTIAKRASDTFNAFTKVTETSEGFQYMSRLLVCVAQALSPLVELTKFSYTFHAVDQLVAGVRIVMDTKYGFGQKFCDHVKQSRWAMIGCNLSFTLSDIGASANLASMLGVLDTAAASAALSSISVFGVAPLQFVAHVALAPYIFYTAFAGYILLGSDSLLQIFVEGDTSKLTETLLQRSMAEMVSRVFIIAAGAFLLTTTGVVITGVLGAAAAAMAVKTVYEWNVAADSARKAHK